MLEFFKISWGRGTENWSEKHRKGAEEQKFLSFLFSQHSFSSSFVPAKLTAIEVWRNEGVKRFSSWYINIININILLFDLGIAEFHQVAWFLGGIDFPQCNRFQIVSRFWTKRLSKRSAKIRLVFWRLRWACNWITQMVSACSAASLFFRVLNQCFFREKGRG